MKITLLQQDISWGNPETNVRNAEQAMEACPGSDLYVLPEMFSTGICTQPEGLAEPADSDTLRWMRRYAAGHDCAVAGSVAVQEDGKYYMLWGSFFGFYIMELDVTDDVMITPKLDTKRQIAGNAYEGINLWKRDGYYYLIGSIGSCCEGQKSTYITVVARSKDLFGPYVDKQGGQMLDNKHEVILHKNDRFVGTGNNSTLLEDGEKNTWMIYQAFEL